MNDPGCYQVTLRIRCEHNMPKRLVLVPIRNKSSAQAFVSYARKNNQTKQNLEHVKRANIF